MRTEATPGVVHGYLSDLTQTAQWNPHVVSCHRRPTQGHLVPTGVADTHGSLRVGDRYLSVQHILGRRVVLHHQLVEHDPPHLARWTATSRRVVIVTTLELTAHGRGTEVTYSATYTFQQAPRLLQRALRTPVQRDVAPIRRGLTRTLARLADVEASHRFADAPHQSPPRRRAPTP